MAGIDFKNEDMATVLESDDCMTILVLLPTKYSVETFIDNQYPSLPL